MSLFRDLWEDPDPIKWLIFGLAGLSVAGGGVLYWQYSNLTSLREALQRETKFPIAGSTAPASTGSLQLLVERATELGKLNQQIEGDKLVGNLDNPSEYIYGNAAQVSLGNLKLTTSQNSPGGATYADTITSATPPREKPITREQIYKFLWNCERSPLMTVTYLSLTPFDTKHRPGQTLAEDHWYFDTKLTIRRKRVADDKKPG